MNVSYQLLDVILHSALPKLHIEYYVQFKKDMDKMENMKRRTIKND